MAKLSGVFKVKGKFAGGTAYNTKNGNIFRTNAQNTKERYKLATASNAPENGRLKQNNREFANCVACARLVYDSFGVLTSSFQSRAWGSLFRNIMKTRDYSTLPLGERVPATVNYPYKKVRLFAAKSNISSVFTAKISYKRVLNLVEVSTAPVFRDFLLNKLPKCNVSNTFYRLNFYTCTFNFETNSYSYGYTEGSPFFEPLPTISSPVQGFTVNPFGLGAVAGDFCYIITELCFGYNTNIGYLYFPMRYYDVWSSIL